MMIGTPKRDQNFDNHPLTLEKPERSPSRVAFVGFIKDPLRVPLHAEVEEICALTRKLVFFRLLRRYVGEDCPM